MTKNIRIRGARAKVPQNSLLGRTSKNQGQVEVITASELRRMVGPGFVKAVGGSGAATITVKDEGSSLTSAVTSFDFVGTGIAATHVGDAVTVTVNGLTVKDEGSTIATGNATTINFVGAGVTATNPSANTVTVTIPGYSLTVEDEGSIISSAATILNFVGTGVTATNSSGNITVTVTSGSGVTALANAHIFVGNATGIATDVALSGDATLANTGALTIANNAITTAKIADGNVTEAKIGLSDNTTDDVSTSKHGFVPKAPNNTLKFLRGDGTWATTTSGNGSSSDMSPYSDGGITKPAAADFTSVASTNANHGTETTTDLATRGIHMNVNLTTATATQGFVYKAAVSSTLGSVLVYTQMMTANAGNWFFGIGIRDNTGKIQAFGLRNTTLANFRYTDINTSSGSTNLFGGAELVCRPLWFKVSKVSTNFVFDFSLDGEVFYNAQTVSATAFIGATINDVGLFIINNIASVGADFAIDCYSFTHS